VVGGGPPSPASASESRCAISEPEAAVSLLGWSGVSTPFAILIAVAAYGVAHSLLAGEGAKAIAARLFGESGRRSYRLAYNAVAVLTLLPVLIIPARDPGRLLYACPWPWAGLALAGQGLALLVGIFALWQMGLSHFVGLRQLRGPRVSSTSAGSMRTDDTRPPRLVINGLYRRVRHPLYSCVFVFLFLTPVMTTSLLTLYLGLSAYLVLGSVFEERRLVAAFGETYRDYQRQVPRILPFCRAAPRG
jgi:protein-S-isoprenylcysteine O-methyltransferase Ste14